MSASALPSRIGRRSLRGHQTVTLGLLFVAGLVNFFDRVSLSVANTTIRAELHLSATQMGWLLSAFALAYGLTQLSLVGLLDRLGTRTVMGAGLAIWSAAQMLTATASGFFVFLIFRLFLGAGESPFYPAGVRSVREWFPEKTRGRATAVMSSSQTFALAAAPPLLTYLMLRIGWRGMFAALGAAGLVASVAWMVWHRARRDTQHAEEASVAVHATPWRSLLRQRTIWGMMLGFGGVNYTTWLYTAWLPGYLQTERHLSLAQSGWAAAGPFLAGAAGMLCSGVSADLFVRRGIRAATIHRVQIVAGMLLSAAATWFVAHASSTPQAVTGIGVALFCIHFGGTSAWGYAQAVSPASLIAATVALQNFAGFLIAFPAPVITGFFVDRLHSFQVGLLVCSGMTVLGAISYATLAAPSAPRADLSKR